MQLTNLSYCLSYLNVETSSHAVAGFPGCRDEISVNISIYSFFYRIIFNAFL